MLQSIDKKNKIVIYLIFFIILSTISNKSFKIQKNYSTNIDEININGLSNKKNLNLVKKLKGIFYQNILFVSKEEINKIILENPIIELYNVKKIYPSTLNIDIKPTKIIAKISGSNQLLVGSNGKLITNSINKDKLPYLFGEFDSNRFLKFKKNLDRSKFNFDNIDSIFFHPSNRWDILTRDNILIKLPEKNLLELLNLAHTLIKETPFKNSKVVDLRISNHLTVY
jgi:cell division protein FtsQ